MTRSPDIQRLHDPPDLPPEPGVHPTFTASLIQAHGNGRLLAGDRISSPASPCLVKDRHRTASSSTSQAGRRRYPSAHRDPPGILDNHSRPHLQRDECMARRPTGGASSSPSRPSTAPAELVEGFFSKFARSVLRTSASHPNKNSRTASWQPWITSTKTRSFTLVLQAQKAA